MESAYGVDFEIPGLTRSVQINDYLLKLQPELLERNVRAVGEGTSMVRVKSNFSHFEILRKTKYKIV